MFVWAIVQLKRTNCVCENLTLTLCQIIDLCFFGGKVFLDATNCFCVTALFLLCNNAFLVTFRSVTFWTIFLTKHFLTFFLIFECFQFWNIYSSIYSGSFDSAFVLVFSLSLLFHWSHHLISPDVTCGVINNQTFQLQIVRGSLTNTFQTKIICSSFLSHQFTKFLN